MVSFVVSLFLGMLPEVLYFTLFLIHIKDLKEKRIKLFLGIMVAYILCIMISRFKIIYYLLLIVLYYFVLKLLYKEKTQIIDIFIINILYSYLCAISFACSLFVKDYFTYYIMLILDRVCLFVPLFLKSKIRQFYIKYCELWNRSNNKKRRIKSITLRNISLIFTNLFIFILNILVTYIFLKK